MKPALGAQWSKSDTLFLLRYATNAQWFQKCIQWVFVRSKS